MITNKTDKRKLRIAIHQPNFFPRLKILQKLAYADIWCVLDSVQYCSREWQNRTIIIPTYRESDPFWLSVPVNRPNGRSSIIKDVTIEHPEYFSKVLSKTLYYSFRSAPYWDSIKDLILSIKPKLSSKNLTQVCVDITSYLLQIANKNPKIIYSSSLPVTGKSSNLIAEICKYLDLKVYLADSGAKNYLKPEPFDDINVIWQDWNEPEESYNNITSWRNISSLNYLARVGIKKFAKHLQNAEFSENLNWKSNFEF